MKYQRIMYLVHMKFIFGIYHCYSLVHMNESKVVFENYVVDFFEKYFYSHTQYQFSHRHFKSFHMSTTEFYSDYFNSWHKIIYDFELSIWPIWKTFCFCDFFFPPNIFHQVLALIIKNHFNISPKNGHQSMDSF